MSIAANLNILIWIPLDTWCCCYYRSSFRRKSQCSIFLHGAETHSVDPSVDPSGFCRAMSPPLVIPFISSIFIPSNVLVQDQISTSYKQVKYWFTSNFTLLSQLTEKMAALQLSEHKYNNLFW